MPLGDDLDAAVAEGIVTDAQAAALRDFTAKRDKQRAVARGHEERFRFMRGFNDFFFAVGVLMLGFGMGFFAGASIAGNLVAAAIIWALAELLARRMRLVLPAMLLACFFVAFVYRAIPVDFWLSGPTQVPIIYTPKSWIELLVDGAYRYIEPTVIVPKALLASAAAAAFYLRFQLPFALLLVAGGLVIALTAGSAPFVNSTTLSVILLGCGAAVFAAAMAFDMSDRERVTQRADCAFWLHLLSAPLIVHSLISIAVDQSSAFAATGHIKAITTAVIVALLAVVAIAIDRRALLVSALGYLGVVIAYAIVTAGAGAARDMSVVVFATLVMLGALVIALGVGWLPLRRALFCLLPRTLLNRLPPAATAA
ncbi:MAG TPA: hypothetical protein VKD43_14500 [Xanthobacteraceae bacterium]|nr:hypothetical protein [Xanthobacteraceae bacterium]